MKILSSLTGIVLLILSAMVAMAQSETPTFAELKQQWSEAVDTLKGYSAAQRDTALEEGKETLNAMDTYIEQLEARTREEWDQLSETTQEKRKNALRTLREERNDLAEWYGGMKHSSAGAWDEMKQGFIDAYGTLNESFGEALDAFER
jgi:TolA-binding protein